MVSHQSATFGGRWHSGNEDLMFLLVVEEQDSISSFKCVITFYL